MFMSLLCGRLCGGTDVDSVMLLEEGADTDAQRSLKDVRSGLVYTLLDSGSPTDACSSTFAVRYAQDRVDQVLQKPIANADGSLIARTGVRRWLRLRARRRRTVSSGYGDPASHSFNFLRQPSMDNGQAGSALP